MESLGGLLFPLLILLLFIPIFLSGRKQRRQMADMQALQRSLEIGDVVTTTSGLRGTVVDSSYEDTVDLEIAEGVVTTWLRAAVREKALDAGATDPDTRDDAVAPVGTDGASLGGPTGTGGGTTTPGTVTGTRSDLSADDANGTGGPRP